MQVLIVDDDPEVTDTLSLAFAIESPGSRVETAASATDARSKLDAGSFDLVILDVNLPDGNGFDVLESFRRSSATPVMMVSEWKSRSCRSRGLRLGADEYLGKPFSVFEMLGRAFELVRRAADRISIPVAEMDQPKGNPAA